MGSFVSARHEKSSKHCCAMKKVFLKDP